MGQTSLQTVRDLVLTCTGHLRKDGGNMTIYPAHRVELGIFCAHPVHGNRKGKPWRGGNLTMSEEIMAK